MKNQIVNKIVIVFLLEEVAGVGLWKWKQNFWVEI